MATADFSLLSLVRCQLRDPSLGVETDEGFREQRTSANLASYQPDRCTPRGSVIPGHALALRQTDPGGAGWTDVKSIAAVVEAESILGRLGVTFEQLGGADYNLLGFAEAEAQYVSEGQGATEWDHDIIASSAQLGWYDVTSMVTITRRLLKQSPGIEDRLRTMLRQALTKRIERGVLTGTGGTEPVGVLNPLQGLPTLQLADSVASFAEAAGAVETVATTAGCQPEQLAWLLSTADYQAWVSADGRSEAEPLVNGGQMAGAPVFWSNFMPSGRAVLGDWSQLYVAMYGNPGLVVNPYVADTAYTHTRISIYQSHGCGVAYPDRFLSVSAT